MTAVNVIPGRDEKNRTRTELNEHGRMCTNTYTFDSI